MHKLEWLVAINLQKVNMSCCVLDNLMEHFPCLILILLKAFTVSKYKSKKLILFQLIHLENGLHLLQK